MPTFHHTQITFSKTRENPALIAGNEPVIGCHEQSGFDIYIDNSFLEPAS
ncbi:hypothetical protein [Legionella impletisoli]|nr:hypothetical protein [Legionella impletisoli]